MMSRVRQIEIARDGIAHGRFSSLAPRAWSRQRARGTAGTYNSVVPGQTRVRAGQAVEAGKADPPDTEPEAAWCRGHKPKSAMQIAGSSARPTANIFNTARKEMRDANQNWLHLPRRYYEIQRHSNRSCGVHDGLQSDTSIARDRSGWRIQGLSLVRRPTARKDRSAAGCSGQRRNTRRRHSGAIEITLISRSAPYSARKTPPSTWRLYRVSKDVKPPCLKLAPSSLTAAGHLFERSV